MKEGDTDMVQCKDIILAKAVSEKTDKKPDEKEEKKPDEKK